MNISVVIPAFNEQQTIEDVVRRTLAQGVEVIVVDDGSVDDTAAILRNLPVTLLRNEENSGKAASLWRGMREARNRGAAAVITLDADGQHRPEDIPRLIEAGRRHPGLIVIGARLHARHAAPPLRRFANAMADFWISWAAGYPIRDTQSGFRLYPATLLDELKLQYGKAQSFVFESEILIEAARRHYYSVDVGIETIYHIAARASHYRPARDTLRIIRMVALKLLSRGMYPLGLLRALRLMPGPAGGSAGHSQL